MFNKKGIIKQVFVLTLVGGLAFWLANFAISRTAIAADYRAAMSISYAPMLLDSLVGGLIIGVWVSFLLLLFYDRLPTKGPIPKAMVISALVLLVVTISIGNPSTYGHTPDSSRYFLIGTAFNLVRILALGLAIGYGCKRMNFRSHPEVLK